MSSNDQEHSVTSTAPEKPPRGVLRKNAPMKPQRSALKIEPLDDKENSSQFKAKETMDEMKAYFKRSIAVIRSSEEFSGAEAADILEAYIISHRESFKRDDIGRHNALLVLEMWRQQDFIRALDSSKFEDSDRIFYVIGDEQPESAIKPRRSNSFKRLFTPLVRRNRSNSRSRKEPSKWSVFSSERKVKAVALAKSSPANEPEVYELALFHLLNIIEVEFLEDVVMPVDKKSGFLATMMEKMGLGGGEERLDPRHDDEVDLLVETHPVIRSAAPWFQMARICAPLLYLERMDGKSNAMMLYLWCKAALNAVGDKLAKMTQNGASPLIPNEFSLILSKIGCMPAGEKLNMALLYLFLLIPPSLRRMLENLIQWLQITMRADAVEDLRSPYYLGKKAAKNKENCRVIIEEIRMFIFPRACLANADQDRVLETLVELRMAGRLGKIPEQMKDSLSRKCDKSPPRPRRWLKRKRSAPDGDLTPVRYCKGKIGKREQGLSETDTHLVMMIEQVLKDEGMSEEKKKQTMDRFAQHHPNLYERFFKSWNG